VPSPRVLFEVEGSLARLTFNRPEARNALTWDMYNALVNACDRVDADPSIRVFVLRGAGGAFASGTDIAEFEQVTSGDDGLAYERRLDGVVDRLERVGAATIAQVQGVAAGGGLLLALACDLRVCTPDSKFGVPVARTLGNCLSAANYARLLDLVGPARTRELLITARLIDGAEAAALGLVTRVVDAAELEAAVLALVTMVSGHAPLTIRATKEAVRRIQAARRPPTGTADDLVAACYASGDFRDGVASFLAKRPPKFTGR
jgi:enoyl-CoA hydratase